MNESSRGRTVDDRRGASAREDEVAAIPLLPNGTRVVDHEILGHLGTGGMGVVYRAVPVGGGPAVALKLLAPDLCTPIARQRFVREVEAARHIEHPNVVRVVGFGETGDGGLFLTMELLGGEDLRTRLSRGTLDAPEIVRIGLAAAAGLGRAHEAGIVHRDVKPANLFLGTDGSVKVLDFGVALRFSESSNPRLTIANAVVGTPAYMAFEQATGRKDEDPRTDVWGLGATLYHAAAGRPPFDASTPVGRFMRIVNEDPDPLPVRVPRWLQSILLRCLRRDRTQRWPDMAALAAALEDGLARQDAAGAATVESRVDPAAEPQGPAALGDEVRIVAMLFARDVADEDAFEAAVSAQGGKASRLLGGRAIGTFGGEAWRGDEAERAVVAGLTVRAAAPGALLGVATGRAVRARAGDAEGEALERAEAIAGERGVAADPETLRRVRGGFDVEAGTVMARRPGVAIIGVRGLGGADTPIYGRDAQVAELGQMAARVFSESQAAAALLVGPAGIGKSRLVHAFKTYLDDRPEDVYLLEARGEAHRRLEGWHAIANALRLRAEVPEGTSPERVREQLLALCPTRDCAEILGEILGAGVPENQHPSLSRTDPAAMRDRLRLALGELLESWSAVAPVVVILEDAHWADTPSLEAIEAVLRRLASRRLLVLSTTRPELRAPLPDFRRIALAGLSRRATHALVESIVGPGHEDWADSIHERCDGNPYFAEELALGRRRGGSELPVSVEAAVQVRLDQLPRAEKDLLRRAAVLGRRFWTEALAAMGQPDAAGLLGPLRRREIVAPEPRARMLGVSEWRFRHALVQEVAYASLTEEQRRTLHGLAARWLAGRPDARALEIARHLELGGDPLAAAPHWIRAAETAYREGDAAAMLEASARAIARSDDRAVVRTLRDMRTDVLHFLGRAEDEELELALVEELADDARTRVELATRRARFLMRRGRYDEAAAIAREGLAIDPRHEELEMQLAVGLAYTGRLPEALGMAEAAVGKARASGVLESLANALHLIGHLRSLAGDLAAAMASEAEAVRALRQLGNPRRTATVQLNLIYYELLLGRHAEVRDRLEALVEQGRAIGSRQVEGYALRDLVVAHARCGDIEQGLRCGQRALVVAREIDEPRMTQLTVTFLAAALLEAGRPTEALDAIDGLPDPGELARHVTAELGALRAASLVALGRMDEGREEATRTLALRESVGGIGEHEAVLFLAAHDAGIPGALERGRAALLARAGKIGDPELRRSFLENVPAHARLMALGAS